eukprot:jgi/Mesvir1/29544/Mv21129-RA.1
MLVNGGPDPEWHDIRRTTELENTLINLPHLADEDLMNYGVAMGPDTDLKVNQVLFKKYTDRVPELKQQALSKHEDAVKAANDFGHILRETTDSMAMMRARYPNIPRGTALEDVVTEADKEELRLMENRFNEGYAKQVDAEKDFVTSGRNAEKATKTRDRLGEVIMNKRRRMGHGASAALARRRRLV